MRQERYLLAVNDWSYFSKMVVHWLTCGWCLAVVREMEVPESILGDATGNGLIMKALVHTPIVLDFWHVD